MGYICFSHFYDVSLSDCRSMCGISMQSAKAPLFEVYEGFL